MQTLEEDAPYFQGKCQEWLDGMSDEECAKKIPPSPVAQTWQSSKIVFRSDLTKYIELCKGIEKLNYKYIGHADTAAAESGIERVMRVCPQFSEIYADYNDSCSMFKDYEKATSFAEQKRAEYASKLGPNAIVKIDASQCTTSPSACPVSCEIKVTASCTDTTVASCEETENIVPCAPGDLSSIPTVSCREKNTCNTKKLYCCANANGVGYSWSSMVNCAAPVEFELPELPEPQ